MEPEKIFELLTKDALVPFSPEQLLAMDRDTVFTLYLRPKEEKNVARPLSRREAFFKWGREKLKRTELEIEADWQAAQARIAKNRAARTEAKRTERAKRRERGKQLSAGKRV